MLIKWFMFISTRKKRPAPIKIDYNPVKTFILHCTPTPSPRFSVNLHHIYIHHNLGCLFEQDWLKVNQEEASLTKIVPWTISSSWIG